ncbi:MAG: hypothetical protein JXR22_14065 [Prolixibacteraceae bacterium]|nr:hypothetical protein [Prolixibacteraceae bacterium]
MKNLNEFLSGENFVHVLSVDELIRVKGGDDPQKEDDDPFNPPTTGTGN